jgi:glutamate racemase
MTEASIGIFDSGFGGLTVMNAVKTLLPYENIIYFGDTENLPYGNKTANVISQFSIKSADFLLSHGVKLLIIACHTACACAYEQIEKMSPVPVIGLIKPSLSLIKKHAPTGKVALLGTTRTIQSKLYQNLITTTLPKSKISSIACPLFIPLIEEGYADHPIAELVVQECLNPLKKKPIEALLLGCSHFPLLQKIIQKKIDPSTVVIDPSTECARQSQKILQENNLLNTSRTSPKYSFYVSGDPEKFQSLGEKFFSSPIDQAISTKIFSH